MENNQGLEQESQLGVMSGATKTPAKSPIYGALDELKSNIFNLSDSLYQLRERLNPILTDEPDKLGEDMDAMKESSDEPKNLAEQIKRVNGKVIEVSNLLERTKNQIEL